MLNYIRENIDNAQKQSKQKISRVLDSMDYELVTDIHNTEGIETRVFQWINTQKNHCIQLIWDGRENWFDLGEFQYTDSLSYLNANPIKLVSLNCEKWFNRKNYVSKKVDELIEALSKKYNYNIN